MLRQLQGYVDFLEILAEDDCFLSSGITYALMKVDKYTGDFERLGAQDPEFYAKFLSKLDRVQCLLIGREGEIVESALAGVPTQIPMAFLTERNSRIDKIFDTVDLQEFSCSLPLTLQAAAGTGDASGAGGGEGGGGRTCANGGGSSSGTSKTRAKAWFSTKLPDDNSRQWELLVGKAYLDFYSTDAKGKENKALFATIRVLHHKINDHRNKNEKKKRDKITTSSCTKYISTGTCADSKCKICHFSKSKAKKIMADDSAKGQAAVKLINKACRKIYL